MSSQRKKELHELRARGLTTNGLKTYTGASFNPEPHRPQNHFQKTSPRKKLNEVVLDAEDCRQRGLEDYEEELRYAASLSTASSDSNGPCIYTDGGGSIVSSVSSVTWQEICVKEKGMKVCQKQFRDILLGAVLLEEEAIIFSKEGSVHASDYHGENDTKQYASKQIRQPSLREKPNPQDPPEQQAKVVLTKSHKTNIDSGSLTDSLSSSGHIGSFSHDRRNGLTMLLRRVFAWIRPRSARSSLLVQYNCMSIGERGDPERQLYIQENDTCKCWRKGGIRNVCKCRFLAGAAIVAVLVGITSIFLTMYLTNSTSNEVNFNTQPTKEDALIDILESLSGSAVVNDPSTPHYRAFQWLAHVDKFPFDSSSMHLDTMAERYIISLLYFATTTSGEPWTEQYGFLSSGSVCKWNDKGPEKNYRHGVVCDERGYVLRVEIANNNLVGSLPWEVAGLEHLAVLHLPKNKLSGNLASRLDLFANLRHLDLKSNRFDGTVPTEIGLLQNLSYLNLGVNSLTGTIPSEIGRLAGLEILSLGGNMLEGSLPSELGFLSIVKSIDLSANNIEGSVPREIGHLESLQVLSLQNNLLSGDLENDFCARHYVSFVTDCLGENSTITCSCCDTCCDKKVCCGALGCREI